ncbi:hypothetical protein BST21_18555 [Mycolicibacterium celeriflavum]|nr:hypothetical protein BST21_18555 [Mycolicibacterium celeriflavum]
MLTVLLTDYSTWLGPLQTILRQSAPFTGFGQSFRVNPGEVSRKPSKAYVTQCFDSDDVRQQ